MALNIEVVTTFAIDPKELTQIISNRILLTFKAKNAQIEAWILEASKAIFQGLVQIENRTAPTVKIGARSIGKITPNRPLGNTPFVKYVLSKEGAGELGLNNPERALAMLSEAMRSAIQFGVSVKTNGIHIEIGFDENQLLAGTPHPAKGTKSGRNIKVDSWLQWVTGPKFDNAGAPGFGLARLIDVSKHLYERSQRSNVSNTLKKLPIPRTEEYSGGESALMLPVNPKKSTKSVFEALTGQSAKSWMPISDFRDNFWSKWWNDNIPAISDILSKTIKAIIEEVVSDIK